MSYEKLKMAEPEYRAFDAVNISTLKEIDKSPAHYLECKKNPEYFKPTEAMQFGTAFHCLLLEREKFPQDYHVVPKDLNIKRNTKEGKANYQAILDTGKTPIKQADYEYMEGMVRSLASNKNVIDLMQETEREITVVNEIDDVLCKGKLDAIKSNAIIDIKTTENSHTPAFDYHAKKYGYYTQAEFYRMLTGIENFYIIAVEKKPPFGHNVFAINADAVEQIKIKNWLNTLKECRQSEQYPAFKPDIVYLGG